MHEYQRNKFGFDPCRSSSFSSEVKIISECFVIPKTFPEKWKEPYHFTLMDHFLLSLHYIQKGLLFLKPSTPSDDAIKPKVFMETLLQKLKVWMQGASVSYIFNLSHVEQIASSLFA